MPIKVLVVDDSFAMRTLISSLLNSDPLITVIDTAKSGAEALDKLAITKPDCIILDLMMPEMDGLTTLKKIMAKYAIPVIIFSAYSKQGAEITFQCLEAGAVGFVPKPSGESSWDIENAKEELLSQVKAFSPIKQFNVLLGNKISNIQNDKTPTVKMIVIGASAGGPQTLEAMLSLLPKNFPVPILIVQHMLHFFLEEFVRRLEKKCALPVKFAEDLEYIQGGVIYFAPNTHRLIIKKEKKNDRFCLEPYESENSPNYIPDHAPHYIDDNMIVIAEAYAKDAIGIILTGAGKDGLKGIEAIKAHGGKTIVQKDPLYLEMPTAVLNANITDLALPLEEIPAAVVELISK